MDVRQCRWEVLVLTDKYRCRSTTSFSVFHMLIWRWFCWYQSSKPHIEILCMKSEVLTGKERKVPCVLRYCRQVVQSPSFEGVPHTCTPHIVCLQSGLDGESIGKIFPTEQCVQQVDDGICHSNFS